MNVTEFLYLFQAVAKTMAESGVNNTKKSITGVAVNKVARIFTDHTDVPVSNITELEQGDQIVFYTWVLHPRCHGIVIETNEATHSIKVIRFTYSHGVVEEWLPFQQPLFKVKYHSFGSNIIDNNRSDPDTVINRARSVKRKQRFHYSLAGNNCKTFARWCKTGIMPKASYGYEDCI